MSALIKRLWALIVIFIVGEAFVVVVLKAQFGPAVDEQVEEEAPPKNPQKRRAHEQPFCMGSRGPSWRPP